MMAAFCTQDNEINVQRARMRAKAFVDQMLSERKFVAKQGSSSEHKPFSYAMEILSTNKDLFMEFLPGPNPKLAGFDLNEKLSECESEGATGFGQSSTKGHYLKNINRKCQYSSETSFNNAHPDKIVILKPASQDIKYFGNGTCHCSSWPVYKKSSGKILKTKPASFSLKEMKSKLKNTFAGARKEPNQLFMDGNSHKLATSGSIFNIGDCICREVDTKNSFNSSKNVEIKENLCRKPCLKSIKGPDIVSMNNTVRKKLDFPRVSLLRKQEFDVIFEPSRHLARRVKNITETRIPVRKKSPKSLEQILSSPDHYFWPINPSCPFSNYLTLNPLRSNKGVTSWDDFKIYDGIETLERKTSLSWSTVDEAHDTIIGATDDKNCNCKSVTEEMSCMQQSKLSYLEMSSDINSDNVDNKTMQRIDRIKSPEDSGNGIHLMDPLSENETWVSTVDDVPSTPSTIYKLNMSDSTKYQEDHQSPISVLGPFFTDEIISPQSLLLQTDELEPVQPLRLDFDECLFESIPQNPQTYASASMNENNYISRYVHLVMQVSCLNWDNLSAIMPPPQELLNPSLFDEVEFLPVGSHTDPKLLFDRMNEVLLEMHRCHLSCPPLMAFIKPKMLHFPLVEAVLYEIMREADFSLLPQIEKRTLNQILSKDVSKSRSWLDVWLDTEEIVNHVSEEVLEESVLEIILEFLI